MFTSWCRPPPPLINLLQEHNLTIISRWGDYGLESISDQIKQFGLKSERCAFTFVGFFFSPILFYRTVKCIICAVCRLGVCECTELRYLIV